MNDGQEDSIHRNNVDRALEDRRVLDIGALGFWERTSGDVGVRAEGEGIASVPGDFDDDYSMYSHGHEVYDAAQAVMEARVEDVKSIVQAQAMRYCQLLWMRNFRRRLLGV